jgi:hypothetical protein
LGALHIKQYLEPATADKVTPFGREIASLSVRCTQQKNDASFAQLRLFLDTQHFY